MPPDKPLPVDQVLALLPGAPPRLAELTAALAPAQLRLAPAPGEWSANEVLAHLRACADVWGACMRSILAQDHPVLRAVNPRTLIESTDYLEQGFQPSLQAFTEQRLALLAVLEPLAPADWSRPATVTGAGKPLERSLLFYASWLASHERTHLKQIGRIAEALRK